MPGEPGALPLRLLLGDGPEMLEPPTDEAHPSLTFAQPAEARTQITLHPPILETVPVARRDDARVACDRGFHQPSSAIIAPATREELGTSFT